MALILAGLSGTPPRSTAAISALAWAISGGSAALPENQRRSQAANDYLLSVGKKLRLFQLHGALTFASIEPVIRSLTKETEVSEVFILNLKLVPRIDHAAANFLADIRKELNITPIIPDGLWDTSNRLCNEDDPHYGEPLLDAAE